MTVPVGTESRPADLGGAVFAALASEFFDPSGRAIPFELRDKRQTQDDPFDEHVAVVLERRLPEGMQVLLSGKSLVSPDLVVARPEEARLLAVGGEKLDGRRIVAVEVKKLNLDGSGNASRAAGMDYNSTPPCVTVKVEAEKGQMLRVPAFYLCVALRPSSDGRNKVDSMALVSGAALNEDVDLYDSITGVRQKAINLGSFGDGADRQRPMLVFANPLGWKWLSGSATLIHEAEGLEIEQAIELRRRMVRRTASGEERTFFCYRPVGYLGGAEPDAEDPFPTPKKRRTETSPRGRFKIAWSSRPKLRR